MCFNCERDPEFKREVEAWEKEIDKIREIVNGPDGRSKTGNQFPDEPRVSYEEYFGEPWPNSIYDRSEPNDFALTVFDKSAEAVELLLKKHDDYGPNNIAMSPGGPLNGLTVRLWDKVARLAHLLESGVDPKNESVYDTLIDISNYGLIGTLVVDGLWPEPKIGKQ